jgi:hypothetical protein
VASRPETTPAFVISAGPIVSGSIWSASKEKRPKVRIQTGSQAESAREWPPWLDLPLTGFTALSLRSGSTSLKPALERGLRTIDDFGARLVDR